jgi:hypothetical protein
MFRCDAPAARVIAAFHNLDFVTIRTGYHISMERLNPDGTKTPLTMPNHRTIKGSALRTILNQSRVTREQFLAAYESS